MGIALGGLILLAPGELAAQWPWSREPHRVTAHCVVEPTQIEQGSSTPLKARAEATDNRKHRLAYVWSGNGGRILGSGPEVEIDISSLPAGVYSVAAAVRDGYKSGADCTAHFQVIVPANPLTARCVAEPEEAEPGSTVRVRVEASDRLGQPLRYRWFTNGGVLRPQEAETEWLTESLLPGEYTVTSRVEDRWGNATDCRATVRIVPPSPPALPPELRNLAQIVFPRNMALLGAFERQQLEKVAQRLAEDPAGRISVEAYAGPEESNPQALAAARAEAVRQLLLEHGADDSRMQITVGLGGRLGGIRNRTLDVIWIPDGMDY